MEYIKKRVSRTRKMVGRAEKGDRDHTGSDDVIPQTMSVYVKETK